MAEHVLASTMIAPKTFEVREYPMPDIPPDAGLLRVVKEERRLALIDTVTQPR